MNLILAFFIALSSSFAFAQELVISGVTFTVADQYDPESCRISGINHVYPTGIKNIYCSEPILLLLQQEQGMISGAEIFLFIQKEATPSIITTVSTWPKGYICGNATLFGSCYDGIIRPKKDAISFETPDDFKKWVVEQIRHY